MSFFQKGCSGGKKTCLFGVLCRTLLCPGQGQTPTDRENILGQFACLLTESAVVSLIYWEPARMNSATEWWALGRKMCEVLSPYVKCWSVSYITRTVLINWGGEGISILSRLYMDTCNSRCFSAVWRCSSTKQCLSHGKHEASKRTLKPQDVFIASKVWSMSLTCIYLYACIYTHEYET